MSELNSLLRSRITVNLSLTFVEKYQMFTKMYNIEICALFNS